MNTGREARRGLGFNLTSAALPLVGSFLVSVLLAPYFGDARWGEYSLVLSAATLLLILAKFGVHAATSRLISEHENEAGRWLRAGLVWRSGFTLAVGAMTWLGSDLLARSFNPSSDGTAFRWTAAVVVGASAYEFAAESLVGLRAHRAQLLLRTSFLALRLAALFAVRALGLGVAAFVAGHAFGQLLPAAIALGALLWMHPGRADAVARARTWDLSLPLALSSASFLVFAHTDRLMLGWFHDTSAVGQFAVARNVVDAALFPLAALGWSVRPALIRALASDGEAAATSTLREGTYLSLLFSIVIPGLLLVLGPPLLVALYTPSYAEAASLLWWMVPLLALRGFGAMVFPALLALDGQRAYARWMLWTAVANVVCNLALIPRWGARGAILATALSLLLLTIGGFTEVRRRLGTWGLPANSRSLAVALLSTVVVCGGLWAWTREPRGLLSLLVAGVLATAILVLPHLWKSRRNS